MTHHGGEAKRENFATQLICISAQSHLRHGVCIYYCHMLSPAMTNHHRRHCNSSVTGAKQDSDLGTIFAHQQHPLLHSATHSLSAAKVICPFCNGSTTLWNDGDGFTAHVLVFHSDTQRYPVH